MIRRFIFWVQVKKYLESLISTQLTHKILYNIGWTWGDVYEKTPVRFGLFLSRTFRMSHKLFGGGATGENGVYLKFVYEIRMFVCICEWKGKALFGILNRATHSSHDNTVPYRILLYYIAQPHAHTCIQKPTLSTEGRNVGCYCYCVFIYTFYTFWKISIFCYQILITWVILTTKFGQHYFGLLTKRHSQKSF